MLACSYMHMPPKWLTVSVMTFAGSMTLLLVVFMIEVLSVTKLHMHINSSLMLTLKGTRDLLSFHIAIALMHCSEN